MGRYQLHIPHQFGYRKCRNTSVAPFLLNIYIIVLYTWKFKTLGLRLKDMLMTIRRITHLHAFQSRVLNFNFWDEFSLFSCISKTEIIPVGRDSAVDDIGIGDTFISSADFVSFANSVESRGVS